MQMNANATNNTNTEEKLIYPTLSYDIVGICFSVHNELGKYAREKQYAGLLERKLKDKNISYERELQISESGNILDFLVGDKIILELKAKRIITKEDYYQAQRYLQESKKKLALMVNFRDEYIKPKRIIRIDTSDDKH